MGANGAPRKISSSVRHSSLAVHVTPHTAHTLREPNALIPDTCSPQMPNVIPNYRHMVLLLTSPHSPQACTCMHTHQPSTPLIISVFIHFPPNTAKPTLLRSSQHRKLKHVISRQKELSPPSHPNPDLPSSTTIWSSSSRLTCCALSPSGLTKGSVHLQDPFACFVDGNTFLPFFSTASGDGKALPGLSQHL